MIKITLTIMLLIVTNSYAGCRCVCMDGQVQAVCSSTLDIAPICTPRICPIETPSIAPIRTPKVPPIGTSGCVQKNVA